MKPILDSFRKTSFCDMRNTSDVQWVCGFLDLRHYGHLIPMFRAVEAQERDSRAKRLAAIKRRLGKQLESECSEAELEAIDDDESRLKKVAKRSQRSCSSFELSRNASEMLAGFQTAALKVMEHDADKTESSAVKDLADLAVWLQEVFSSLVRHVTVSSSYLINAYSLLQHQNAI
jgi:hypothetical protein